jgi:hypothetical protein
MSLIGRYLARSKFRVFVALTRPKQSARQTEPDVLTPDDYMGGVMSVAS